MPDVYRVIIEHDAEKVLAKLPRDLGMRLRNAIKELAQNPRPRGVKKLQGHHDVYRRRVGDWRIVYAVYDERLVVLIIEVAARGNAYKDV
jgi:mRNA interferase RelE/StbE